MAGHVFVSYGRSDVGYVNRLADTFTRAGLSIWKDDRNLEIGDRWEHEVRDRVDDCAAMVIVMSPAAEASMNVANELARARDRGKTIFPVLLSGEVWFALSTINYFDARDRRLPDQRLIDQLQHLGTAVEGRTDPGPTLLAGDLPGQAIAWQHRPGLLDALVTSAAGGGTTVVAALAGQRGVGKTQLAAAYARLRMQHGWPVIVWANAGSEQGIITALDELADAARLRQLGDDPTEAARAALRWLRRHDGPCLLVYDNAVDPDLIRAWTPSVGAVQTVVTSTMRALDALGPLIDVSLFTPGEATAYLDRRTKLMDPDGAAELAVNLGYLPLALAQAAAVIGPGRRYPTYRKYIRAIDATPTAKLLPRTAGDPYPHGLVEAVLLALDDLSKASDGIQARHLLDRLAVLAPVGADSILLNVLTRTNTTDHGEVSAEAAEPASELGDPDELAAVLTGRSLTVGADSDRVVIHRLIQRIVRERCRQAGTLTAIVTAGAAAVADAAERVADRWQQRALLAEYSQHAQSLLTQAEGAAVEAVVRLQGRLLYLLNENYSYSVSVSIGPDIVLAHEQVLGPDHPDTLRASRDLARAYRAVGRLNAALALSTGTLADYERVLGPVHPDTLTARLNLASAYREMGRLDEAIALVTRTLADRERVLGSDHPDTLTARLNLAAAYREIGRLNEAVALLTRTLADRERVLGPDHPNTFSARLNLADTYQAMGRLDESIALLTGTLAHSERALGIDHPHTLTARHSLAFAYRMVGRLAEAIDLYTRVLDDRERVLGPDHPSTFGSRNNLAYTYQLAGQVDEALALFTRTLADRERVLGPDHPNTLGSRHNLAQANQAVGRIDEALALFTRALADRERVLGPEHPHTRLTRSNLAGAYRAAGRAEDADALLRPDEPRSE